LHGCGSRVGLDSGGAGDAANPGDLSGDAANRGDLSVNRTLGEHGGLRHHRMRHQSGGGNEVLLGEDRLRHHGMLGVDRLGDGDGGGHVAERHLVGGVRHADGLRHPLHHGGDGGVSMALDGAVGEIAAEAVRLDDGAVEAGGADEGGGGDDAAMDVAAGKDDTQCNENLQEETLRHGRRQHKCNILGPKKWLIIIMMTIIIFCFGRWGLSVGSGSHPRRCFAAAAKTGVR
jgi:hypothetical protein